MSTYVVVEISPETTTRPVLTRVSQATRPVGSSFRTASRTPSEIWSQILSGWPSVTDSEVNRWDSLMAAHPSGAGPSSARSGLADRDANRGVERRIALVDGERERAQPASVGGEERVPGILAQALPLG